MLIDELRQILRDLVSATGATQVAIQHDSTLVDLESPPAPELQRASNDSEQRVSMAIGGGALLTATFPHCADERTESREAALERAARALRTCARRWEAATLPPLQVPDHPASNRERVLNRIRSYLQALTASQSMINACVVYRGELLACAEPMSELERERVPFTVKRVDAAAARRRGYSHADVAGDDYFAQSFYIDACLVAFFAGPYAPDFVKYRVRLVTRELAHLLPLLDDDPGFDPVQAAPVPE